MTHALALRLAQEGDLAELMRLYASLESDPAAVLPEAAARARFASILQQPGYRIFLACDPLDGAVVGTYTLLLIDNLAHRGAPSAVVENVVVDSRHTRRGIGRQMMAHAIAQARAAGCYKLALSSNSRRASAHAFYRSLGFAQHGLSFLIEP